MTPQFPEYFEQAAGRTQPILGLRRLVPPPGRPTLLDLFCGAGGAARGYKQAGFRVIGVDNRPQPNYAGDLFIQGDALEYLRNLMFWGWPMRFVAAIHASPPCQAHSTLKYVTDNEYPELVAETRALLEESGKPYVIENVPGAPLRNPVVLCGSTFGLGADCADGVWRQLRRHRLFETNFPVMAFPCNHQGQPVGVYGTGGAGQMTRGYKGTTAEYREAMGMPWASRAEIAQAIPPAYTEHIGQYLLLAVKDREVAA